MRAELLDLMSQVESNLRFSQLHPLRPSHTDQSQGSKLSLTDRQIHRISISRSPSAHRLWDLKLRIKGSLVKKTVIPKSNISCLAAQK